MSTVNERRGRWLYALRSALLTPLKRLSSSLLLKRRGASSSPSRREDDAICCDECRCDAMRFSASEDKSVEVVMDCSRLLSEDVSRTDGTLPPYRPCVALVGSMSGSATVSSAKPVDSSEGDKQ